MGLGDTLGNKAEEAKGKIKEEWGDATDNTRLEAEGKAEQVKAKADQVGDDAADAGRGDVQRDDGQVHVHAECGSGQHVDDGQLHVHDRGRRWRRVDGDGEHHAAG